MRAGLPCGIGRLKEPFRVLETGPMHLDGDGPLFRQVYRALRDAIVEGDFSTGSRLPATRDLATELRVSRATVLLAYEQLADEGYVTGRQGSGTYVQGTAPAPAVVRAAVAASPRLSRSGTTLVERRRMPLESAYIAARPPLRWDFRYGMPSLGDFPLTAWRRCLGRAVRRGAWDYGPPQGSPALPAALAA